MKAGSSETSEMPFVAHPQPSITLTFNSGDVRDSSRIKVELAPSKTTFNISKSERPDSGEYTVVLENQYGKATLTIKVTVLGKLNSVFRIICMSLSLSVCQFQFIIYH